MRRQALAGAYVVAIGAVAIVMASCGGAARASSGPCERADELVGAPVGGSRSVDGDVSPPLVISREAWRAPPGVRAISLTHRAGELAVVEGSSVCLLDQRTGQADWAVNLRGSRVVSVAATEKLLLALDERRSVFYGISVRDGSVVWRRQLARERAARAVGREWIAVSGSKAAIGTGSQVALADVDTGRLLWESEQATVGGVVARDGAVIALDRGGAVVRLSSPAGRVEWRRESGSVDGRLAVANDLLVTRGRESLSGITTAGALSWTSRVPAGPWVLAGDTVYAVDGPGNLHAVSTADGVEAWHIEGVARRVTQIAAAGNQLILASDDGGVATVDAASRTRGGDFKVVDRFAPNPANQESLRAFSSGVAFHGGDVVLGHRMAFVVDDNGTLHALAESEKRGLHVG